MSRNLFAIALALLLIAAGAVTAARASIIETLQYTGALERFAKEQAAAAAEPAPEGTAPTAETAPEGTAPTAETAPEAVAPVVGESQPAAPFHFVLKVEWPEGRIPGDAEGIAVEVMSIFREAAAAACASIPGGPGPVAGVTFPTDSSIEYWCGPVGAPEGLKIATAGIGRGL